VFESKVSDARKKELISTLQKQGTEFWIELEQEEHFEREGKRMC
jgi:hypothetical protein